MTIKLCIFELFVSKYFVDKIISIPILINNIHDEVIWKFTPDGEFSVKAATWTNDDKISHSSTKLLNYIWKLNLIRKSLHGSLLQGFLLEKT